MSWNYKALGPELKSSVRTASALNCKVISLTLYKLLLMFPLLPEWKSS